MAHAIEKMMYVGEVPWHGLGTRFEIPPTLAEAIVAAGLDWHVATEPLFTAKGEEVDRHAVRRSDSGAILGTVGRLWTPLQNEEMKDWFEPFHAAGFIDIETAGSLLGGRKVFFLCRIKGEALRIKGDDVVRKYILLSNAHDGSSSVRVGFTPVRVVCANTLSLSHRDRASQLLRVRHTAGVVDTLERVRDIMNLANQQFEATAEQYRYLADRNVVAREDLEKYVRVVFNRPKKSDTKSGDRLVENVVMLFERGRGNDLPEIRGTWWAAYNSVTEYIQHLRGADAEKRLDSAWFGDGATVNQRALAEAMAFAA